MQARLGAGAPPDPVEYELDCGESSLVLEGHGSPPNRVNYVIVGDGYNDESRLRYVNDDKVDDAIERLLPSEIEVDWKSVVLNGNRWWNAGGRLMV